MRVIVHKIHEKRDSGDYSEFESMRRSLIAWAEQPVAKTTGPEPASSVDRRDLIRLMAILAT